MKLKKPEVWIVMPQSKGDVVLVGKSDDEELVKEAHARCDNKWESAGEDTPWKDRKEKLFVVDVPLFEEVASNMKMVLEEATDGSNKKYGALQAIADLVGHTISLEEGLSDKAPYGDLVEAVRKRLPGRSSRVQHYVTMVEGLLALRAVGEPLSQETEAEIAEIHDELWRQMTDDEQAQVDGPDGLIEQVKRRWGVGVQEEG